MILCHHSDSVRKSKVEVSPTRLEKWAKREKTQRKNNTGYLNEVPSAGVWVLRKVQRLLVKMLAHLKGGRYSMPPSKLKLMLKLTRVPFQ